MLKIRKEVEEKCRREMKATKLKSLATTTGPTRLSAGPQAPYSCVAHENLKLYGLRRGGHLAHNCETKSE